jgi:hypothetical protein
VKFAAVAVVSVLPVALVATFVGSVVAPLVAHATAVLP